MTATSVRKVRLAAFLLGLAAVVGVAVAMALVIGGGIGETWRAARSPDLLAEPRAAAGVVAAAGVLAGGVAVALALAASLRAPGRRGDELALQVRIERALARSRLSSLEGHVVVCGDGELARTLADELGRRGAVAVVVERDGGRAARARLFVSHVVEGDPRDEAVLREAGAPRAAAVALCGLRERDRLRVAAAVRRLGGGAALAAVHDADGARAFAEVVAGGGDRRPAPPATG